MLLNLISPISFDIFKNAATRKFEIDFGSIEQSRK